MTETDLEPFAQNQLAAALPAAPDPELLDALRSVSGNGQVQVLEGPAGRDVLAAEGFLDRVRMAVSEDARAIDRLRESIEKNEAVVVVYEITSDEQARQASDLMTKNDAGWIFRFDELTWTELHSPATREVENGES